MDNLIIFIYLFIYYWIYIPSSRANTSEWSAGSRVWYLGLFTGFQVRFKSFVCYRMSSLQPKYQTTGVSTTLHYTITACVQPYSVQPTLLACQCRGPRIKSQICSGDPGPFAPAAACVTTRPPRSYRQSNCIIQITELWYYQLDHVIDYLIMSLIIEVRYRNKTKL